VVQAGGLYSAKRKIEFQTAPMTYRMLLQSDVHIMSPNARLDVVRDELRKAKAMGARVNINGDLFDAILPSDLKRYVPSAVDSPDDDLLDVAVKRAIEIYGPYADLIDMVGMGNHEGSALKHHSVNLSKRFVDEINRLGGKTWFGGYGGWITYSFYHERRYGVFRLRYHHGAGGASPVTRGTIDFTRMSGWIEGADLVWMGHKHFQKVERVCKEGLSTSGVPTSRIETWVMTGGYLDQTVGPISYATAKNMPHLPVGGAFVELTVRRNDTVGNTYKVEAQVIW